MTLSRKFLVLSFLHIFIISCRNNLLCFNEKDNYIYTCDGYYLNKIEIKDKTDGLTYLLKPKTKINGFYVDKEFNNFSISTYFLDTIKDFKMEIEHSYTIINVSEGDATPGYINIYVNRVGDIIIEK